MAVMLVTGNSLRTRFSKPNFSLAINSVEGAQDWAPSADPKEEHAQKKRMFYFVSFHLFCLLGPRDMVGKSESWGPRTPFNPTALQIGL
jgi:hypothetical protein